MIEEVQHLLLASSYLKLADELKEPFIAPKQYLSN
jgi:hypothetical protein